MPGIIANRARVNEPSLARKKFNALQLRRISAAIAIAFLTSLSGFSPFAFAQTRVPIFDFEQVWWYDTSGNDLGTGWRTNYFDDTAWPLGSGLLEAGETT